MKCSRFDVATIALAIDESMGKNPSMNTLRTAKLLLDLGGDLFTLLGVIHAVYTHLDIRRPRRLVPRDPAVALSMAHSPLRIAGGGTTMWKAWVGFNIGFAYPVSAPGSGRL